MRSGFRIFIPAILISGPLAGAATAQPAQTPPAAIASQVAPGGLPGDFYDSAGVAPGTAATPERLSDGTLAESANTTALATSTYHQPTGFLPGMKP